MKIELKKVKVKDLCNGYEDKEEEGVVAYGGKLDVRPPYQREFIYKDAQRNAVIETILKGFPLNVMYWVDKGDETYEIMDGQQRTISICQFVEGDFSINCKIQKTGGKEVIAPKYFESLTEDERQKIRDYELTVYFCTGTDSEKLDWFKTINIAGEKLTDQELRNAVYSGSWVTSAKKYFSKTGCPAYQNGGKYMTGTPIRQDYLEKVLGWIASSENTTIEGYMAKHQHDPDASALYSYFEVIINWINAKFPTYRKEMKGVQWGLLYNQYGNNQQLDANKLEEEIVKLMADDDVTKKSGIYDYVLSHNERSLSIRAFNNRDKRTAYEKQKGKCAKCKKQFELDEMEADHITPWSEGGKTIAENCQMLCKECNRKKSNK